MERNHILIADDEPHLVQILTYNLEKQGFRVSSAVNGIECVEAARTSRPDLIISDYQMPLLDGLAAAVAINTLLKEASIPIIMLTARGHPNLGARTRAD